MNKKIIISLLTILLILIFGRYIYDNILILDDQECFFEEKLEEKISHDGVNAPTQQGEPNTTPVPELRQGTIPNPNSLPKNKGYYIHINLDIKTMHVYKDGKLIKTYPVAGGKPDTPSPEGTWRITSKGTWGKGFGGTWLGLNVPWGSYGIHGTKFPWLIGKQNASKGCIRMLSKDAKELSAIINPGTTVTIVQKNKAFRSMRAGDIGSDIRDVEIALTKLGYYKGSSDGRFGTDLKSSVIKFQKDSKIKSDGVIDKQTYTLIIKKTKEDTLHEMN